MTSLKTGIKFWPFLYNLHANTVAHTEKKKVHVTWKNFGWIDKTTNELSYQYWTSWHPLNLHDLDPASWWGLAGPPRKAEQLCQPSCEDLLPGLVPRNLPNPGSDDDEMSNATPALLTTHYCVHVSQKANRLVTLTKSDITQCPFKWWRESVTFLERH